MPLIAMILIFTSVNSVRFHNIWVNRGKRGREWVIILKWDLTWEFDLVVFMGSGKWMGLGFCLFLD